MTEVEWFTAFWARQDDTARAAIRQIVGQPAKPKLCEVPEWLDATAWQAWETHRREIKKTLKDSTRKAQWRRLAKLKEEGHEPADVIEHSIAGGYTGLYAQDKKVNGHGRENSGEWLERMRRDADEGLGQQHAGANGSAIVGANGGDIRGLPLA